MKMSRLKQMLVDFTLGSLQKYMYKINNTMLNREHSAGNKSRKDGGIILTIGTSLTVNSLVVKFSIILVLLLYKPTSLGVPFNTWYM